MCVQIIGVCVCVCVSACVCECVCVCVCQCNCKRERETVRTVLVAFVYPNACQDDGTDFMPNFSLKKNVTNCCCNKQKTDVLQNK